MILRIINYTVRILIVVIGILLLSGIILSDLEPQFRIMAGIVFTLFGIYRISLLYTQEKRYKFMKEDDDDENKN
ncbi:MAG TPA: hypothetical protein PLE30_03635 [Candidatus Kapabacteria bacterium]|nr:hypothetical protein [Candidatus Kapabacteria bacterium]